MRRFNAVFPILAAFSCGYHLPDLLWRIETGAEIRTATDLASWIIVPVLAIAALIGAWQAWKSAAPPRSPN